MVDRRVVSEDDVARIGLRIKAARTLTSLNQEEFAERHDFGYASVKNWELGKSIPRTDTVSKIVLAFRNCGVQTTRDWLLYGSGSGPTHLNITDKDSNTDTAIVSDGSKLEREIQIFERWFCNSNKYPIVAAVADSSMEPFFSNGDVIGAEEITSIPEFEKSNSQKNTMKMPFLVEIEAGHFQPRFLGCDSNGIIKYAYSNNSQEITELKYTGLAKIICIRKIG